MIKQAEYCIYEKWLYHIEKYEFKPIVTMDRPNGPWRSNTIYKSQALFKSVYYGYYDL